MTETTYTSARLERPRESALKGVCVALARSTGTDPVLWRVLFVVLSLFGGLGLVLYLLGVALIPVEGEPVSLAERLVRGPDRSLTSAQVLLLVVLAVAVVVLVRDSDGLVATAVLGGLAVLWWRRGTPRVPAPAAAAAPAAAPVSAAGGTAPPGVRAEPAPAAPTWTPPPPRPRSPLGGLTVSVALLVAGILLMVGASGGASVPAEAVLAGALATLGAGLVAGSFFGRSPGLISLAVLLSLALGGTVAARPALDNGVGERTWTPAASGTYRLGIGDATLDLRSLPAAGGTTAVTARVDVGHLLVLVPDGLRVALEARSGIGNVQLLGVDYDGHRIARHLDLGPPGPPQLTLDLSVRTGMVEVRRG